MTSVKLKTATLAHWAKVLLYERIPANVSDPASMEKATKLAQEFSSTNPWALAQVDEFSLDRLLGELLPWARSKGYELLDEPPCPYTPALPADGWVRTWGPTGRR